MCKISQLAEKNTGQLAIRRAYRTGALFFIIRAYEASGNLKLLGGFVNLRLIG